MDAEASISGGTRRSLNVLAAALALGAAGDLLMGRATGAGINVGLWTGALVCAAWLFERQAPTDQASRFARRVLLPSAVAFACFCAWRASPVLRTLDVLAVAGLIAFAAAQREAGFDVRRSRVARAFAACARGAARLLTGAGALALKDVRWREAAGGGATRRTAGVLRGAALAVPLLIVFGGLFAAADEMFARVVGDLFAFDGGQATRRVLLTLSFAWLAGGALRSLLRGAPADAAALAPIADADAKARFRLGAGETSVALGSLDALFALFLIVQARYLFGGAEWVEATAGLTYAEYARRGFFELVLAAALVLPLLLGWHALVPREDCRAARVFRALAGGLVALVGLMMLSAVRRMWLYAAEYGLTELRLYTTAFMLWVGAMLLIFTVVVLWRERRERFAWLALAAGLWIVAGLHAVNPDEWIVRVNAARAAEARTAGRVFDADYAASLSDDAVPALVAALPALSRAERAGVARSLLARDLGTDPRAWSLARSRARAALVGADGMLRSSAEFALDPEMNAISPVVSPDIVAPAGAAARAISPSGATDSGYVTAHGNRVPPAAPPSAADERRR